MYAFVDFHGHSRQKNVFMYGCNNNSSKENIMTERILPLLFHKQCDAFNFDNCNFELPADKDSCARVAVRKEFKVLQSYTLETSYAGTMRGKYRNHHFTIPHLKKIGGDFICAIFTLTAEKKAVQGCIKELREMYPSLNHLLNEDEGKYKDMAAMEKQKLEKLLSQGKIRKDEVDIQPGKAAKMSNTRTVYEGERDMLNRGWLSRWFGCR